MNVPGFVRTTFLVKDATMPSNYDESIKAKAVRLVREHTDDHSEWAAMCAISARLGMTEETLRNWWPATQRAGRSERDGPGDAGY
jgi:transposase